MVTMSARIAGLILLLCVLVAGKLSTAFLVTQQGGGDYYPARKFSINVASRKEVAPEGTPGTSKNSIRGRTMAFDSHQSTKAETRKEIGMESKMQKTYRILVSREDYRARFVAFNADYKGPRHHPPKNN
ncbi:root meristem growth factor 2-like [Sesamum indicum]|uniref:ROOT MERISTEM growth factor 2-like n=1 Tax=Sesamum indicum TaxID=4182 RepID=A0A6I9UMY8_SESIN|nr:root meristem growth factor 2-like [Sesamum indicum]XP_011102031.1 root meristem growth factor 2-like [Sesamum indicum]